MKKLILAGCFLAAVLLGGYFLIKKTSVESPQASLELLGNCVVPEYTTVNLYPVEFYTGSLLTQFSVGFKAGTDVRFRDGHFVSLCGADMTEINAIVDTFDLIVSTNRLPEEKLTELYEKAVKNNPKVVDLNLAYLIMMPNNTSKEKIIASITAFHNSPLVSYAQHDSMLLNASD